MTPDGGEHQEQPDAEPGYVRDSRVLVPFGLAILFGSAGFLLMLYVLYDLSRH